MILCTEFVYKARYEIINTKPDVVEVFHPDKVWTAALAGSVSHGFRFLLGFIVLNFAPERSACLAGWTAVYFGIPRAEEEHTIEAGIPPVADFIHLVISEVQDHEGSESKAFKDVLKQESEDVGIVVTPSENQ